MFTHTRTLLGLAGGALILTGAFAASAQAAPPVISRPTISRPVIGTTRPTPNVYPNYPNRGMMPGQDWWKIYPWSNYNAWRNIYWYPPYNTNYPFAPNQFYGNGLYTPVIPSYGIYGTGTVYPATPSYAPAVGSPAPESPVLPPETTEAPAKAVPHPTGNVKVPPPNAGLIRVELPDAFGTVMFDGQKVSSTGTTRNYVTPELRGGQGASYMVTLVSHRDGQQILKQRQVNVTAGTTVTVDFTSR